MMIIVIIAFMISIFVVNMITIVTIENKANDKSQKITMKLWLWSFLFQINHCYLHNQSSPPMVSLQWL